MFLNGRWNWGREVAGESEVQAVSGDECASAVKRLLRLWGVRPVN